MKPIIEFCIKNYALGTEKVKQTLEEDNGYDVLEHICLGHCQQCMITPYALVEGEFVEADDANRLLMAIEQKIKERQAFEDLFNQIIDED